MNIFRKNARGVDGPEQVNGKPSSQKKVPTNSNNSTKREDKQPVFNDAGKVVGYIHVNKFIKHVLGSKHMLRAPRGWSNDRSIIEFLIESNVQVVEIHDKESNKVFRATNKEILDKGRSINRRFGDQIVLPLRHWEVIEENKPKQLTFLTSGIK